MWIKIILFASTILLSNEFVKLILRTMKNSRTINFNSKINSYKTAKSSAYYDFAVFKLYYRVLDNLTISSIQISISS